MKKIYILTALMLTFYTRAQHTWTNGGSNNLWSNPANWDQNSVPTGIDDVIFDGTSTANCTIDVDMDVNDLTITAAYTGVINGTSGNSRILQTNNFSQAGGTFISTDDTYNITGDMTITGGTFNHNGGNVTIYINAGATNNISGAFVFNDLIITHPTPVVGATQRTMNFGTSATTANLFLSGTNRLYGYLGNISITSNLSINGTSTGNPTGNTGVFTFTGAGPITINGGLAAARNKLGNITINTSGGLTMTGHISLTGTWTGQNIAGYIIGTSTVNFYGTAGVITAGTTATSRAYFDNLTVASTASLTLSGTSQINIGVDLTNNGGITSNNSLVQLSGTTQNITGAISGVTRLNALEVTTAGTKTFGHAVEISDSLKIGAAATVASGGNLTLKSSATKKGRIAQIAFGGSITGNVTVETFAPGGTTDWAVLGVSGITGKTMNDWYGDFPMAIDGSATGVTSAGGYFESVQGWNENNAYGYDTTITIATALTVGKGYWVYLGDNLTTTGNLTISVTGVPVQGNVTIPLTMSSQSGYNLISNPYASPISWTKLRNGNALVNNATYIYNADLGITTSFVNGVSTPLTSSANDDIPMGQGFYVQCIAGTNLTAQESNKVSNNTGADPLLRGAGVSADPSIGTIIRLNVDGGGYHDDAVIRFHNNATNNYDTELDANKLYGSPGYVGYPGAWTKRTAIATQMNNNDYSINSIPYAHTQNAVIPVVVKVYSTGSYTISGTDLQNIPTSACISLFDKVTNITHNLRSSDYVCNINDTTNAARFVLTVCADLTTDVKEVKAVSNSVGISKDSKGVFVKFNYDIPTDATIYATNILGQTIMVPKKVKASNETMYLDINSDDQLIFVTVVTGNERTTQKILNIK